MTATRVEQDSLGPVNVPADRLSSTRDVAAPLGYHAVSHVSLSLVSQQT